MHCIAKLECSDAILIFMFDSLYCLVIGLKRNPLPNGEVEKGHEEAERNEECDLSFILKDDIGYVWKMILVMFVGFVGITDRRIETIFEF